MFRLSHMREIAQKTDVLSYVVCVHVRTRRGGGGTILLFQLFSDVRRTLLRALGVDPNSNGVATATVVFPSRDKWRPGALRSTMSVWSKKLRTTDRVGENMSQQRHHRKWPRRRGGIISGVPEAGELRRPAHTSACSPPWFSYWFIYYYEKSRTTCSLVVWWDNSTWSSRKTQTFRPLNVGQVFFLIIQAIWPSFGWKWSTHCSWMVGFRAYLSIYFSIYLLIYLFIY